MGATPGLAEELAEEYGPGVAVTEDPAVGTPGGSPSTATPQQEAEPPATAEGEKPAEGAPSAEGTPGEPKPAEPAASEEDGSEGAPAPAEPAAAEITPDQAQALKAWGEGLVEEAVTKVREEELPKVQRGLDNKITALMDEKTTLQTELDEANRQIREESIKGLSEEDAAKMREGWANEDKSKGLDTYAGELDDLYVSVMAVQLSNTYNQYGVTIESLEGLEFPEDSDPVSVMTDYCKDKQIESLQNGTAPTEAAPAKAAQPAPSEASQPPPPAGSKAPSDAGGGGVPPAPVERDEGKGMAAMGNNVATHGWEDASFAKPRR